MAQMLVDNLPSVLGATAAIGVTGLLGPAAAAIPLATAGAASAVAAAGAGALGGVARAKIKGRDFNDPKVGAAITKSAGREGLGELAGGAAALGIKAALGRPGKGILRILGNRVVADIAESDEVMRKAATEAQSRLIAKGVPAKMARRLTQQAFTPAEITNGRIADFVEGATSQSSLFGQPLRDFVQARNQLVDDAVDNFFDATAKHLDPDDVGELLANEFKLGVQKIKEPTSKMHDALAQRLMSAPRTLPDGAPARYVLETGNEKGLVDLTGIRSTSLKRLRENVAELEKVYPDSGVKQVLDQIDALPDKASFDAVKTLRTAWGDIAYSKPLAGKSNTEMASAKKLVHDLSTSMETSLKEFDDEITRQGKNLPSALAQWKEAGAATARISERYEKRWVKKLFDVADERTDDTGVQVVNGLVKRGLHDRITTIRDTVGATSDSWKKFQGFTWDYLISKSRGTNPTSVPSGAMMLQMLTGENSGTLGSRMAKEIFGPGYGDAVKLAKAISHTQQNVGTPGKILMELTEGGLAIRALKGQTTSLGNEALGLLFSGTMLRKIFTSPSMSRLVIQGMGTPLLSREAVAIPARLMTQLSQEELDKAAADYEAKYGPQTRTLPGSNRPYTIGGRK
jgi:hypothetical protein